MLSTWQPTLFITAGQSTSRSTSTLSARRSRLVKFVSYMCRPRISLWTSWLRAYLYSYSLIFYPIYAFVNLPLRPPGVLDVYISRGLVVIVLSSLRLYIWMSPLPNGVRCSPYSFLQKWPSFKLPISEIMNHKFIILETPIQASFHKPRWWKAICFNRGKETGVSWSFNARRSKVLSHAYWYQ